MRIFIFIFLVSCASADKKELSLAWPTLIKTTSRLFSTTHDGIDIAVPQNTPVHSAHKGVVVHTTPTPDYGKVVIIEYSSKWATMYAHLNKILVKNGNTVQQKQKIGLSGSTGRSGNPHLHFELMKNKLPINPMPFFKNPK